jgi:L-lactate dehydrogenase (cytochrome)
MPRGVDRAYNIAELRKLAKKRLPAPMFHYIDGGADDEWTLRRNTSAFDSWEFRPRCLVDVAEIDTSTTVFGEKIEWPFFCSPTALSRLFHHEGERAVVRAAEASGTLYSLSSFSSMSIEEVAAISGIPKAFQVYVLKDRGLTREFLQRARDSGYKALQLTVDVAVSGNRERDIVTGMTVPPKLSLMSLIDIAMHPAWVYRHLSSPKIDMANVAHNPPPGSDKLGGIIQYLNEQLDRSVTWDDAEWMIGEWGGPFAIKGVMTAEDARRAKKVGATAVMLSNHGGRQLDYSPAPFDVLREVADEVGGELEIICDGGIRRGVHILKALALGATVCSAGRPYLYGLGAGGEAGAKQALKILRTELVRDMALLGAASLADINERMLRRVGDGWPA